MDNYKEYEDIYNYAKWVAENFWDMYKEQFQSGHQNLDSKDLIQEAYLEVFTKIPIEIPYSKDRKHLKLLVIQCVLWKMQKLLRKERPQIKVTFNKERVKQAEKDNIKLRESEKFNRDYYSKIPFNLMGEENNGHIDNGGVGIDTKRIVDPKTESRVIGFKFEDIKQFLTDREYQVLYLSFHDKKPFRDIGRELNISHNWVSKFYHDAIEKLRKHFK
jgi:RNA polymerase sigma factor (sigma-70 family)